MQSAETIYKESVRPLPLAERIRLANIILRDAGKQIPSRSGERSALDILQSIPPNGNSRTSSEIDEYLHSERDSWDD